MFATPSKDKNHSSDTYIQPQLEVGAPDDEYEKEANDVADKVMRMTESDQMPKMSTGNESIQRMRMDEDSVKMADSNEGKIQMNIQNQDDPPKVKGTEKQGDVSGNYVFLEGGDLNKMNGLHGKWVHKPSPERIEEIYQTIKIKIIKAKEDGAVQSARNLEYWLGGKGGIYKPTFNWLFSVPEVNKAIELNKNRFFDEENSKGESINIISNELIDGETRKFHDLWERIIKVQAKYEEGMDVTPNLDYAFAYGSGLLTSTGDFTLTRKKDKVFVEGIITNNFTDRYDWELDLFVTFGQEFVYDEDMKLMEVYKGAKPFDTELSWINTIEKTIRV